MSCRKNVKDLSTKERADFVEAVKALKANGTYDQYVADHVAAGGTATPAPGEPPNIGVRNAAHRGPSFLPWHREFLRRFEQDLQVEVPGVTIPYWNWFEDAALWDDDDSNGENIDRIEAESPVLAADFMGGDGDPDDDDYVQTGPFAYDEDDDDTWTVVDESGNEPDDPGLKRGFGNRINPTGAVTNLPVEADLYGDPSDPDDDGVFGLAEYDSSPWNTSSDPSFRNALEGFLSIDGKIINLHNRVHVWVDGDMWPMTSPNDPLFFLHHCFVDKLWADWQAEHPGSDYLPDGSESDAPPGHRVDDAMTPWSTTPADVLDHRALGYTYDTDPPIVESTTPSIVFNDVAEGSTTVRAAVYSVNACEPVHLEITDGPTVTSGPASFGTPLGASETVDPRTGETEGRIWISYTGTNAGDTASGSVTVQCTETGDEWTLPITANTIARPTVAVDLVLDRSGSMGGDSGVDTEGGEDLTRMDVLDYSAPIFVSLLEADDGVGVVSFNQDAHDGTTSVAQAGAAPFGAGRVNATNAIDGLTPGGSTSIGDGVAHAHGRLSPLTGYDETAMVVLTDGHENEPAYIADVAALIDESVFAIGMGTPEQLRPAALDELTNGTGGYLMMTEVLDADDYYRLAKYFLQVLAGVKNYDLVLDPEGRIAVGQTHRVPFDLTEADARADVVLLTPSRDVVKLALETPDGELVEPGTAAGLPEVSHVVDDNVTYYRMTLPVSAGGREAREGRWHAVLSVDEKRWRRYLDEVEELDPHGFGVVETHGVRYNLNVQTESDLRLRATRAQDSYEPGATITLRAVLTEYDVPVADRAAVDATVTRPDGTTATTSLDEVEPGVFETRLAASLSGAYQFSLVAEGRTLRGRRFTREQLLTAGVWNGGDAPTPTDDGSSTRDEAFCRLLTCLADGSLRKVLEELGVDADELEACLEAYCERLRTTPEDDPQGDERPRRPSVDVEALLEDPRIRDLLSSISGRSGRFGRTRPR